MRLKRRVSLKPSTWNRREKQSVQDVDPEPEIEIPPQPVDETRHDQNEWQWMQAVENAIVKWDFGGLDRAPESVREVERPTRTEREAPPVLEQSLIPEQKKKGRIRPLFGALRKKLRRKPKPLLNLEEENDVKRQTEEQNPKQPLLTYDQWDRFMDTVAFPEKSKPYLAIKDYVATSRERRAKTNTISRSRSPNEVVQENDSTSETDDSNDGKMSLAQYLSTQSVDEESVHQMEESGVTWEDFMDMVAFPEKILTKKYNNLLTFIAKNKVPPNDRALASASTSTSNAPKGSLNNFDKYALPLDEEEQEIEEQDDVQLYSMVKDAPDEDLGISLTLLDGHKGIFVAHVARGSKAAASGLTPGMQIISINQDSCPDDLEEAEVMLESDEDRVQIFAQSGALPGIVVQGIGALEVGKSAFSELLNQGFLRNLVLKNDNIDNEFSEGEEPDWDVQQQQTTRNIQSKTTRRTKHFTIFKESQWEVIGVAFVQTQDWPGIFVNQIMPSSKFYGIGLKKGMRVVSVNNEPCPDKIDALIQKLQTTTGALKLGVELTRDVVKSTLDRDNFITATIIKNGGENPGLMLRKDRLRGGIFVKSIDPDSDFVGTKLRPGLRIVSINGHECPKDVRACMWEIQQVDGIFDIIAEKVPEKFLRLD